MKRITMIAAAALLSISAVPVLAAGPAGPPAATAAKPSAAAKQCTQSTQECLDHMVEHVRTRGWVGVELDGDENGALTITAVEPGSPAKRAGLREGDILTAMNGIRFSDENKEAMKAAQAKMTVGATVTYSVERAGSDMDVAVVLEAIPDAVMAKWIGRHMLEHTSVAIARN